MKPLMFINKYWKDDWNFGKISKAIRRLSKDQVIAASLGVFIVTFLTKIAGFIEKIVLSYYWGTGSEIDVYLTVFTIITSIFLFTREIIEPGVLNYFVRYQVTNSKRIWGLFNVFFRALLIPGLLIAFPALFFPGLFIDLFAPGFSSGKRELAIRFFNISFIGVVFYSLSSLTGITLNAYKNFAFSAVGDLVFKLIIIIAILLSAGVNPQVLAWGLLAACVGRLATHLVKLGKRISYSKVDIGGRKEYSGIWRMTWPLLFGVSFSQLALLSFNFIGSYFENGSIAATSYAKKIAEFPVILFPYVLSIVVFPFFINMFAKGDKAQASQLLTRICSIILVVFLPLSVFFFLYSAELVELIYKRGAFDERSLQLTYLPLKIFSCCIVFMALETILVIFFYSYGNTIVPVVTGILGEVITIAFVAFFSAKLGYIAIALSFIAGKTVKNIVLLIVLRKQKFIGISYSFLLKTGISTLLFTLLLIAVKFIVVYYSFSKLFISTALIFIFSFIFYALLLSAMKVHRYGMTRQLN